MFQQKKLKHILVRHEQGATHAAGAMRARPAKWAGVLVTSGRRDQCGDGPHDALDGLHSARLHHGQVPTHLIGNDAFQDATLSGITRPCTKHNYLVRDVNDLARVMHEAFHIARSGRPGAGRVDIPKDVQFATGTYPGPERPWR